MEQGWEGPWHSSRPISPQQQSTAQGVGDCNNKSLTGGKGVMQRWRLDGGELEADELDVGLCDGEELEEGLLDSVGLEPLLLKPLLPLLEGLELD